MGRRRFFGVPLFCYVLLANTMEYVLDTFVEYADNIRPYWRAHWGGDILLHLFFGFLGEFEIAALYYGFAFFSPPRHHTSETMWRDAGQRQTKRNIRQLRRVSRARRMATPEGTGSTRVTSRVIPRPAWLVEESAVLRESSFRPVDSQLTDIGKIYTKSPAFFLSW